MTRRSAQLPGQLRADDAGHHLVGEDEVDVVPFEQIEGLGGRNGGKDVVTLLDENHPPQGSGDVFIIDA